MHDEREYLQAELDRLERSRDVVAEGWRRTHQRLQAAVQAAIDELRTGTAPRGVVADDLARALRPQGFAEPNIPAGRRSVEEVVPPWGRS